ncbi:hypothetical protein [Aurantiacibacter rhizosphaerae]|uniref:Uncharacterized protein n=1 Tax=Aurantiacibacter rhizosphaerae TaxID=2691582 RepID=A0A844XF40_9SPHN|nr:hypothetical protein [Aurantiacibacter rhizosphaerae]MWV29097.1 hypothetical protein [Aurantiacibacter rhizosphaerae]
MKTTLKILAAAALLASTPAMAGEYAGNGKYVPGGDTGASACSYSGLNDDDDGQGFTQSFAAFLRFLGIDAGRYFNAGMFCRGNM